MVGQTYTICEDAVMQFTRGTSDRRRAERVLPPLAVLTVAAVLVILTIVLGPVRVTAPDWLGDDDVEPMPELSSLFVPEQTQTPFWRTQEPNTTSIDLPLREIALVFLTAAAAVLVYVAFRLLRQVRVPRRGKAGDVVGGELDELEAAEELRRAAEDAEAALGARHQSPTNAIIAAWVTLEDAAAEVGDKRRSSQTPSEFTANLLHRHNADTESVQRLLHLYHEARFSTHPDLSPDDVDAAQAALTRITQTLAPPNSPSQHGPSTSADSTDGAAS